MTKQQIKGTEITETVYNLPIKGSEGSVVILSYKNTCDIQVRNMTKRQAFVLLLKLIKKIL
jgi:hypothetical protein